MIGPPGYSGGLQENLTQDEFSLLRVADVGAVWGAESCRTLFTFTYSLSVHIKFSTIVNNVHTTFVEFKIKCERYQPYESQIIVEGK